MQDRGIIFLYKGSFFHPCEFFSLADRSLMIDVECQYKFISYNNCKLSQCNVDPIDVTGVLFMQVGTYYFYKDIVTCLAWVFMINSLGSHNYFDSRIPDLHHGMRYCVCVSYLLSLFYCTYMSAVYTRIQIFTRTL